MFAKDDNGTLRILTEAKIIGPKGQQASRQILELWSAAELKAWNIYPVTEDAAPEGKREVSRSLVRVGDTVHIAKVLEDITGAVRQVVGVNGVVQSVFIGVPTPPEVKRDIFADAALPVGGAYDAKDKRYDRLDIVTLEILFEVINDVRVLKGQAAITRAQFKTYVKGKMT